MTDLCVPEPGLLVARASGATPRRNAVDVRHVDDDMIAGVWTDTKTPVVFTRDTPMVRVTPTSDGMYDVYRSHPIDDRLPDWLTWDAINAFVVLRPGEWLNVYPDGFPLGYIGQSLAQEFAADDRVALIHPDGNTINICDGKTILDTHHRPDPVA